MFRNPHTWHGGTPNISGSPRPIPGIGVAGPGYTGTPRRTLPREIYEGLSARGKQICAKIVATDGASAPFAWAADSLVSVAHVALVPEPAQCTYVMC